MHIAIMRGYTVVTYQINQYIGTLFRTLSRTLWIPFWPTFHGQNSVLLRGKFVYL